MYMEEVAQAVADATATMKLKDIDKALDVKLHSKRVKMKTTLETSEEENYTQNE